jgi:2-polyprenyl-3-methyl-5-hydroxy-6-metoxy-1,4-benzoquinol methylase
VTYTPDAVRAYFDTFAEREWDRLAATVQGRANYAVHRRFLDAHVRAGMRVLDVGAGPGRFAIDLIGLGAEVAIADLSRVQLDLARRRLDERGLLDRVEGFHEADVVDLAAFGDGAFDVVVCFGGAVSYTKERHPEAVRELTRVVRPGGRVLLSVMSLYGALRLIGPLDAPGVLETFDAHLDWNAVLSGADVVLTRPGSAEFHQPLALFTSDGLRRVLHAAGLQVESLASANPLLPQFSRVPKIAESKAASDALEKLEVALCDRPGLVDAGGHLIAVARRSS